MILSANCVDCIAVPYCPARCRSPRGQHPTGGMDALPLALQGPAAGQMMMMNQGGALR